MRLIDADKIHLNLWVPSKNNETVKAFENSVIDALDRQPTVEAIPIEWILNWLNKDNKHYCSVDQMLEEWENENE